MSRGLGKIEHNVLVVLMLDDHVPADERTAANIAPFVYHATQATPAQHSAVRRALASLQRKGMVDVIRFDKHDGQKIYHATFYGNCAAILPEDRDKGDKAMLAACKRSWQREQTAIKRRRLRNERLAGRAPAPSMAQLQAVFSAHAFLKDKNEPTDAGSIAPLIGYRDDVVELILSALKRAGKI